MVLGAIAICRPGMAQLVDPMGDAVDSFGAGPPLLDIDTISVTFDATDLFFEMTFHTPISPASVLAPDSVAGLLEFDTDQNPGTGFPPLQNFFSPPFVPLAAGTDYAVDVASELFHPGFVDVVQLPGFILVDTVPITYGPMSFSGQIALASLGGDDGVVDFTSIIGTFSQPTDATDEVGTSTAVAGDGPSLDIKPGSCPNSYNRNSHGVLPVALVGSESFDLSQVDLDSLLLVRTDGEGGSVAPNFGPPGPHPTIDDVATPFEGEECDCHSATGDGIDDLMMHFQTDDVVAILDLNSFPPGAFVPLTLTGTLDGSEFEVDDCVRLVPPGTAPGLLAVTSNLPSAWIDLTPPDNAIDEGGFANFVRSYPLTTEVTLTAPSAQLGWVFVGWNVLTAPGPWSGPAAETGDGVDTLIRSRSVTLPIESAFELVEAVYEPGTLPEPGDGTDPGNDVPTAHRGDHGLGTDDAPLPQDDPSGGGVGGKEEREGWLPFWPPWTIKGRDDFSGYPRPPDLAAALNGLTG